jgi:hypothetical protein
MSVMSSHTYNTDADIDCTDEFVFALNERDAEELLEHLLDEREVAELLEHVGLDDREMQLLVEVCESSIAELVATLDDPAIFVGADIDASAFICGECGMRLKVPKRGPLPRFCGATCRKRASRRRR